MIDDDLSEEQDVSGRDDHSAGAEPLVTCDDAVMGGEPVFVGTRIPVAAIAAMLDGDTNDDEILQGYPALTRHHLAAARRWPSQGHAVSRSPSCAELGYGLVSRTSVPLGNRAGAGRR